MDLKWNMPFYRVSVTKRIWTILIFFEDEEKKSKKTDIEGERMNECTRHKS